MFHMFHIFIIICLISHYSWELFDVNDYYIDNSKSLIQSGGYIATDENSLIYNNLLDGLYEYEPSENIVEKVSDTSACMINVTPEYLFYRDTDYGNVYKLNRECRTENKIIDGNVFKFVVIDNGIYFLKNEKIYHSDLNGENIQTFVENAYDFIYCDGIIIYTLKLSDDTTKVHMIYDNIDKELFRTNNIFWMDVYDDNIFYINSNYQLKRYNIKNRQKELLSEQYVNPYSICMYRQNIYYKDVQDGYIYVYDMKKEKKKKRLKGESIPFLYVVNDRLLMVDSNGQWVLHNIK